jgi:hypothetical protein
MEEDDGGVAYSPKENSIVFLEDLKNVQKLPFIFTLKEGEFQDYLLNDLAWPIFSEKFKNILEHFLSNQDCQWINANIEDSKNQYKAYVLKLNNKLDVLDKNKTIFAADDFVVKAVLSKEKIKNLNVFLIPGSDFRIVVSKKVKEEIEKNKLTGTYFSKVPVK